jgi:hypothetical protein
LQQHLEVLQAQQAHTQQLELKATPHRVLVMGGLKAIIAKLVQLGVSHLPELVLASHMKAPQVKDPEMELAEGNIQLLVKGVLPQIPLVVWGFLQGQQWVLL